MWNQNRERMADLELGTGFLPHPSSGFFRTLQPKSLKSVEWASSTSPGPGTWHYLPYCHGLENGFSFSFPVCKPSALRHFSELSDLSAWQVFCTEPAAQRALRKCCCLSLLRSWSCSFNRMIHPCSGSQAWDETFQRANSYFTPRALLFCTRFWKHLGRARFNFLLSKHSQRTRHVIWFTFVLTAIDPPVPETNHCPCSQGW